MRTRVAKRVADIEFSPVPVSDAHRPTQVVNLDSRGKPVGEADVLELSRAKHVGQEWVDCHCESVMETMERGRKEERERGTRFEGWAKGANDLVKVQVSARRWIAVRLNSWHSRVSIAATSGRGVFRGGEIVCGPDEEDRIIRYLTEHATEVPAEFLVGGEARARG